MITVVIITIYLSNPLAKWNNSLYLDVLFTFLLYMYLHALYVSLTVSLLQGPGKCHLIQEVFPDTYIISSMVAEPTSDKNSCIHYSIEQKLLRSLFH